MIKNIHLYQKHIQEHKAWKLSVSKDKNKDNIRWYRESAPFTLTSLYGGGWRVEHSSIRTPWMFDCIEDALEFLLEEGQEFIIEG